MSTEHIIWYSRIIILKNTMAAFLVDHIRVTFHLIVFMNYFGTFNAS